MSGIGSERNTHTSKSYGWKPRIWAPSTYAEREVEPGVLKIVPNGVLTFPTSTVDQVGSLLGIEHSTKRCSIQHFAVLIIGTSHVGAALQLPGREVLCGDVVGPPQITSCAEFQKWAFGVGHQGYLERIQS